MISSTVFVCEEKIMNTKLWIGVGLSIFSLASAIVANVVVGKGIEEKLEELLLEKYIKRVVLNLVNLKEL